MVESETCPPTNLRDQRQLFCGKITLTRLIDYFYDQDLEYALKLDGRFDKKKLPDQTYAVDGMTGEFVNIAPSNAQGNF